MNTQNEQLASLLTYLTESVKTVGDGVKTQLPLVADDIVRWEAGVGWMWLLIPPALIVLLILVAVVLQKGFRVDLRDSDGPGVLFVIGIFVLGVLTLVGVPIGTSSIVKAHYAPRMVVLDYVKSVLR